MTYVSAAPASEIGTITAAYELKPRPANSATIMFIGFDTMNGATPGARNTANANASVDARTRRDRAGASSATTSGVRIRIAASLLSSDGVTSASANTTVNVCAIDRARARASIQPASRSNAPTSWTTPVITMMQTSVASGRHCTCAAATSSRRRQQAGEYQDRDPEQRRGSRVARKSRQPRRGRHTARLTVTPSVVYASASSIQRSIFCSMQASKLGQSP